MGQQFLSNQTMDKLCCGNDKSTIDNLTARAMNYFIFVLKQALWAAKAIKLSGGSGVSLPRREND